MESSLLRKEWILRDLQTQEEQAAAAAGAPKEELNGNPGPPAGTGTAGVNGQQSEPSAEKEVPPGEAPQDGTKSAQSKRPASSASGKPDPSETVHSRFEAILTKQKKRNEVAQIGEEILQKAAAERWPSWKVLEMFILILVSVLSLYSEFVVYSFLSTNAATGST